MCKSGSENLSTTQTHTSLPFPVQLAAMPMREWLMPCHYCVCSSIIISEIILSYSVVSHIDGSTLGIAFTGTMCRGSDSVGVTQV